MNKIILLFFTLLISSSCFAQHVQLHYAGSNQKITEAVAEANKILSSDEFYRKVDSIQKFDNTTYSGSQITKEMNAIKTIEVTEYYKKHTKTTAKTETEINVNTAKLNRSLASITNTLVHETIHAVDWTTNKHWDYTHRTQYEEIPPVSAPYVIGLIAEKMVLP
jgi:hypothetical protein